MKLKIGDKVRPLGRRAIGSVDFLVPLRLTGIVEKMERGQIGVRFPFWEEGHTLGDHVIGSTRKDGYWFLPSELMPVAPPPVNNKD